MTTITLKPFVEDRPVSGWVAYDVHARLEHSYAEYKYDALKR